MGKIGVLLVNLGTPDHCDNLSVYRYLTEFLNDPFVVDLPFIIRFLLVNLIIVPFRFRKSLKAYQAIWRVDGSPLLHYSRALQKALSIELGDDYHVELGMRYGHPSINAAASCLIDCERIIALPLFPHYSRATTESAIQKIKCACRKKPLSVIRDFCNAPPFIESMAHHIQTHLKNKKPDFILFSYHGLPERSGLNYRTDCRTTSQLIADQLQLSRDHYDTSFQSRLRGAPWIQPYTDLILLELIQKGVKHLAVVCPSFVADCLETLEEIGIRLKKQWIDLGGESFTLIPALNDDPVWVKNIAKLISDHYNL